MRRSVETNSVKTLIAVCAAFALALPAAAITPVMPASQGSQGNHPTQPAPTKVAAPAPISPKNDPNRIAAEKILREAATFEKDNCETAFLKYQEANQSIAQIMDKATRSQLESIASNKVEKLNECYQACQPGERQKSLLDSARSAHERGEDRRAIQISKRLLVGKNDKCMFWQSAKDFLRTLPKQAEEMDSANFDPCQVTPDVQKAMTDARESSKKHAAAVAALETEKGPLTPRLGDIVELYRSMDATRVKVFELREEFLDCDSVYKPLVSDAISLRDSYGRAQDLILTTYKAQVDGLAKRVKHFQRQIADQNAKLLKSGTELDRLKAELDGLSAFNEELYNDLFALAGTESAQFAVTVEGRRIEQPVEEIQKLVENQAKVMETLSAKYPEYFKDGINVEALKRRKLVLEKVAQMMGRFGKTVAKGKPTYGRAMAELDATIRMMDKAIAAGNLTGDKAPAVQTAAVSTSTGWFDYLAVAALGLAVVGAVVFVFRRNAR